MADSWFLTAVISHFYSAVYMVMVSDPDRIIGFLKTKPDTLTQLSLERILRLLQGL